MSAICWPMKSHSIPQYMKTSQHITLYGKQVEKTEDAEIDAIPISTHKHIF